MQTVIGSTGKYEELFLQHYNVAVKWALKITKYDHELANDLVHNVYLQFQKMNRNGKTFNIETFDRYLYISLRNSYISHLRQNIKIRERETAMSESPLSSVDPREQLKVQDKLFSICQYACRRKETSIGCSILILRFFHGYFPSEVAQILNSSRNVVEARLAGARREAVAYLENPEDFDSIKVKFSTGDLSNKDIYSPNNILYNLHRIIFNSRRGKCFEQGQIAQKYLEKKPRITRSELSHIVSCHHCLDETNKFHGLMLLEKRDPLYSLGKERSRKPQSKNEKFLVRAASAK